MSRLIDTSLGFTEVGEIDSLLDRLIDIQIDSSKKPKNTKRDYNLDIGPKPTEIQRKRKKIYFTLFKPSLFNRIITIDIYKILPKNNKL